MEQTEKVKQWVSSFPGWEAVPEISADTVQDRPGALGIFPEGTVKQREQKDVLGNFRVRLEEKFRLIYTAARTDRNASDLVCRFADWVCQQNYVGGAPRLGDEPEQERVSAYGGKLAEVCHPGIVRYEMTLLFEYTKFYEVRE